MIQDNTDSIYAGNSQEQILEERDEDDTLASPYLLGMDHSTTDIAQSFLDDNPSEQK